MRIEGAGIIGADGTSLDIHLEITKINENQPSATLSAPPGTPTAVIHSTAQSIDIKPNGAWYQQDKPSFGAETGE